MTCIAVLLPAPADSHILKIWNQDTGRNFTSIEPPDGGINDVCMWKDQGLILLGCDAPKIQVSGSASAVQQWAAGG